MRVQTFEILFPFLVVSCRRGFNSWRGYWFSEFNRKQLRVQQFPSTSAQLRVQQFPSNNSESSRVFLVQFFHP